jgi:Trypsin-co-occurring domain 2
MIELQTVIEDLRTEILDAVAAAETAQIAFELDEVEIELTVVAEKSASGGAKVRFWVAEIGADAKISRSQTQLVRLKLMPRDKRTGSKPWVRGKESSTER